MLKRLVGKAFTMEYKYDGERAQVHILSDGSVKVFSRSSEDNSEKYPDLNQVIIFDLIFYCIFLYIVIYVTILYVLLSLL